MKTIEEIYKDMYEVMPFHIHTMVKPYILEAMQAYAQQQLSIAVEKALQVAANKAEFEMDIYEQHIVGIDKQSILSLAQQILEELKGGDGDD